MEVISRHDQLRELIDRHGRTLFSFAYRMTLDLKRAMGVIEETFLRAYVTTGPLGDADAALPTLVKICLHVLDQSLPRSPEISLDALDQVLSTGQRRTGAIESLCDPERGFRVWDSQEGCLTAVLNCLPPEDRAAFAVVYVLGLEGDAAADVLGVGKSELKTRLSRAHKRVSDYLSTRCRHIEADNACHCRAKVKKSLTQVGEGAMELGAVYRGLPEVPVPGEVTERLMAKLDSGAWDELRKPKRATGT